MLKDRKVPKKNLKPQKWYQPPLSNVLVFKDSDKDSTNSFLLFFVADHSGQDLSCFFVDFFIFQLLVRIWNNLQMQSNLPPSYLFLILTWYSFLYGVLILQSPMAWRFRLKKNTMGFNQNQFLHRKLGYQVRSAGKKKEAATSKLVNLF